MPPRVQVSERVHYPRVRYVVAYPPRTPQLPYHDHPGGEEYLVLSGAFCDTNFEDVRAPARAAQESEIPNFKGSDLGHFPFVSADFWTSDHLSERSRRVDAFSGSRARGTLTLKRR